MNYCIELGGYPDLQRDRRFQQIGRVVNVSRDDGKCFFNGRVLVRQHLEAVPYLVELFGLL
jgi:hypothetical protein